MGKHTQNIRFGGKDRPISMGILTLSQFGKDHNLSIGEVYGLFMLNDQGSISIRIDQLLDLAFYGFYFGAKRAGERPDFTRDDVAEWVDVEGVDWMTKIMESIAESMPQGEEQKEKKPEAVKAEATPAN